VGAWLSPVVLAALAARVVAGDGGAPTLVTIVAVAALVGLLAWPRMTIASPSPAPTLALLVALVPLLAANLTVMGDLARLLGHARVIGIAAGAVLAMAVVAGTAGDRGWRLATALGTALVLLPLGLVVASVGSPWAAWSSVASRPALTFDPRSAWVTDGGAPGERAALVFQEPHRLVAASPATWRVLERDSTHVAVREWRLGPGDALTLRPGDELAIDPGARVRFEAGRRVPGAPPSGIAWADGGRRALGEMVAVSMGAIVTLLGGGLALAPALPVAGATAILAPVLVLAFVIGATLWGVYGIALAPELSLAPRSLAPVLEVLARVATPSSRRVLIVIGVAGVAALFLGGVLAWRARITAAVGEIGAVMGRPAPSAVTLMTGTAAVVALATALAVRGGDPWRLFTWALGLAATAAVAPRLAGAGPRAEVGGTLVGALVFGALAFGGGWLLPAPAPLLEYPALAAAPVAWLAARLARPRR
jgi:hypothetical protein